MHCNCSVCKGMDPNREGFEIAEKEVIPFFKKDILNLRYPNHPFPMKYQGLLASILCYCQVLAYNRKHGIVRDTYYTENKWLLKYGSELSKKFGIIPLHQSKMVGDPRLVCEFNVEIK